MKVKGNQRIKATETQSFVAFILFETACFFTLLQVQIPCQLKLLKF
jgi:hypothetical protein